MASSSSLTVRISADLNDFSKGLNAMTKGVDQAAKKIEGFGKALTIGITVPVVAAAAALAKMAAENEDTAGRLSRVFGSAADSVNASIQTMMKSVPEANTELQKMAISVDNMAQGLGLAPGNAAKMSESLLKLAGDASAFAHVPMADALDALSRGLAGKTKGLLQFGIAINEAEIKAKALSMGLVHQGNTLTETGTALASYALIMERSTRIQGEAERTAGQMGKSFAFLKRDVGELADNVSHLVLPALSDLANKARDVVGWFGRLDDSTVKTFFNIAAAAALVGPAIVIIVRLIDVIYKARTAFLLLSTAGAATTFASLAALPFGTIVLGIAGVAGAVLLAADAWKKYNAEHGMTQRNWLVPPSGVLGKSGIERETVPSLATPFKVEHVAPSDAQLKGFFPQLGEKNAPTEIAPAVDAMKALEDRAAAVTTSLKQMASGWTVPGLTVEWFNTLTAVETKLGTIANKFDPVAVKLRGIVDDLKEAAATTFGAPQLPNLSLANLPGLQAPTRQGAVITAPQVADLPGLTAANLAALRYADTQDFLSDQVAYDYQRLRSNLELFGIHLTNLSERMQVVTLTIASAAINFAQTLVANAGGSGKGAGIGRGLGGLAGGIVGSLLGPAGSVAGAMIGSAIGTVVGTGIGGLIGGSFDRHKDSVNNSASALNSLAKTVDKVTSSITNVPAWFKVQTARFEAAPVLYVAPKPAPAPAPTPPNYGSPSTPPPGSGPQPVNPGLPGTGDNRIPTGGHTFNIDKVEVNGVHDLKSFLDELAEASLRKMSTGSARRLAFASGIR